MVDVNKLTTPANMRWKLVDRSDGAENHAIEWQFRVGERVKIRLVNEMDSDHPMHHPFHIHGAGRFLILRRDGTVEPNLVWKRHRARAHRGDRGHRPRGHEYRALDGALPHRRAPRERHDVQLRCDRMTATATEHREVVVIGGGQAGLAIGYLLAEQGRRFTILEAAGEPAAAWRAALGLAHAVHAGPLRQPAGPRVPW